jgi:secreted PhoX family phosphatase
MDQPTTRREMLRLAGAAGFTIAGAGWLAACSSGDSSSSSPATTAVASATGYGPLAPADANGVRMPEGFGSRVIATAGEPVASTGYTWPLAPDGGATFTTDDGGWIYVVNSELPPNNGGVSMVRFDPAGEIVAARSICSGTSVNCAGGATPWDTWLTCEELPSGLVHECDPTGTRAAVPRPALGTFTHEAAAVDPDGQAVYLTEDQRDGGLYRFVPDAYPDLTAGTLEVLTESAGTLAWAPVPDPSASSTPPKQQVATMKVFNGGEGLCYRDQTIYFTTKGDNRVWCYDIAANALTVVYHAGSVSPAPLTGVDNVTVTPTGDLYVAEDGGDMQIVLLAGGRAEPVVQVTGVDNSEITGPAFSPDGTRLYFSSQRNPGRTYEVTGPWAFS